MTLTIQSLRRISSYNCHTCAMIARRAESPCWTIRDRGQHPGGRVKRYRFAIGCVLVAFPPTAGSGAACDLSCCAVAPTVPCSHAMPPCTPCTHRVALRRGHDARQECEQREASGREGRRHAAGHRLQERHRGSLDRNAHWDAPGGVFLQGAGGDAGGGGAHGLSAAAPPVSSRGY